MSQKETRQDASGPFASTTADAVFDALVDIDITNIRADLEATYQTLIENRLNYIRLDDPSHWSAIRDKAQAAENPSRLDFLLLLRRMFQIESNGRIAPAHPNELTTRIRKGVKAILSGPRIDHMVDSSIALYGGAVDRSKMLSMLRYDPQADDDRKRKGEGLLRTSVAIRKSVVDCAASLEAIGFVTIKKENRGVRHNLVAGIQPSPLGLKFTTLLIATALSSSFDRYHPGRRP